MLTARINPVQFVDINKALHDRNIIFLVDLKISKNSLILPKKTITINKKIKDHKPLWIATSNAGINLISLKNKGWGIPQNNEAMQV